jgi:hypothetical protein
MDTCQLCHVNALWLVLSQHRAALICRNDQDPFATAEEAQCVPLGEQLQADLNIALRQFNVDAFLLALYACITFQIISPKDKNDEDYVDNAKFP